MPRRPASVATVTPGVVPPGYPTPSSTNRAAPIGGMESGQQAAGDGSGFEALRRAARHTYGADAAGYRDGRPDYPGRVYEGLRSRCGVGPGSRVLEVGPGSGLVTGHLVAAGARVVAVEPDRGFAEYLGRVMPQVRVVGMPFEA